MKTKECLLSPKRAKRFLLRTGACSFRHRKGLPEGSRDAEATAESLNKIYTSLVDTIRESHKDNDEALEAIDKADAYHQKRVKTISTTFTEQLLRINEEDLIPALLSESPETIRKTMSMIGEDKKPFIVIEACDLLRTALAEDADIVLVAEKFKAITGEDD
ncbi:MAG: hypothetical protein HN377_10295 [Alphaproteobacteria bacterium]|nr:hypothetical protein [Alphaproteobacteria bacterium]MBT7942221.1 hypothetical protein [Alphaproteobacteria bacterium]